MIRSLCIIFLFSLGYSCAFAARVTYASESLLFLRSDSIDNFNSYAFPKLKSIIQSCHGDWKDWNTQSEKGRDCEPNVGPNKISWVKDLSSSCERIYTSDGTGVIEISDELTCGFSELKLNLQKGYHISAIGPDEKKPVYEIGFSNTDGLAFANLIAAIGATIVDQDNLRLIKLNQYGNCRIAQSLDVDSLFCTITFQ